ncbi:hypothetical protein BC829DRAFT_416125 [Chytridium lagenaria]|nr:hypothetical protein BC829DRAFT_416125 [Chytridium lagenaria]
MEAQRRQRSQESDEISNHMDDEGVRVSRVGLELENTIKELDNLSLRQMEIELERYSYDVKQSQSQTLLGSRSEYLREQISEHLQRQQKHLAPYSYMWDEQPWVLGQSREHQWIGDPALPSGSMLEDDVWSTLRHGEARQFPLENPEVSKLFRSTASAMHIRLEDHIIISYRHTKRNSKPSQITLLGDAQRFQKSHRQIGKCEKHTK